MSVGRVLYPFVGTTVGGSHISTLELIRNLPPDRYKAVILLFKNGLLARYLEEQKNA